jgi:hypothetical protein
MVAARAQPPVRLCHEGRPGRIQSRTPLRLLGAAFAFLILLSGCTYSSEEPGLFRPQTSQTPTASERPRLPPRKTNPALPVAGEAIWTTAEGLGVTVRFAIHAIRRIEGATVLDWSVTPLNAPKLRTGDPVPGWVDLGLTRQGRGDVDIVLIDEAARRAYRPLSHVSRRQFNRCLCSPMWATQLALRIGETRMLQLAFPRLPADVTFLDVNLANVATFWHVPVHALGQAPVASDPTDLARPADKIQPASEPRAFAYPGSEGRRQSIQIRQIVVSPNSTSVEWTVRSITDQPSISLLAYGPPIGARLPNSVFDLSSASANGPQIRPSGGRPGPVLKARWITARVQGRNFYECLCTSVGIWAASLRQAGGAATVTTTFPPLPADTSRVDVTLPEVTTLRRLPVVPAVDAAATSGHPVKSDQRYWTYEIEAPPNGWSTYDWPTPTPEPLQLRSYNTFVEEVVRPPGW